MNETDVREELIRPLLRRLGYRQGSDANILTEKTLRYEKAFLGRKKSNDPPLIGRADYICEVVSYGRWVVEAKPPSEPLTLDDAQQAHTYAAHPEIAALFFLVTNGRVFRLYRTSHPDAPDLEWAHDETSATFPILENILGPDAIKKNLAVASIDIGKPLAKGFGSTIRLSGGTVTYLEHRSSSPAFGDLSSLDGAQASVIGKTVSRTSDGLIEARLELRGPYTVWDAINQMAGVDVFVFRCSDEFVSKDVAAPSIFQNLVRGSIATGAQIPRLPGQPRAMQLPFGVTMKAYTEAIGSVEDDRFRGTFQIAYEFELRGGSGFGLPSAVALSAHGLFDIAVA